MWRNIIGQGTYQLIILFGILYLGEHILEHSDETVRNTFLFNSFVFCQVSLPTCIPHIPFFVRSTAG
jgi:hypothetical protein